MYFFYYKCLMFKQLTFTVLLLVWYIYCAYYLVLPSIIINKEKEMTKLLKGIFQSMINLNLKYAFEAEMYYKNEIKVIPNKINILTCNHVCTVDWEFVLGMLKEFGLSNYSIIGKKSLIYIPGFGFSFLYGDDIKLSRKWETDQVSLDKQLEEITDGIIIIFPEGTRFEIEKQLEGREFSKKNNLPIYNNLLVPKSKGLWAICNKLRNLNKLGEINDLTIIMDNFRNQNAFFFDLIKKPIGKVFIYNRKLTLPDNITENEVFKKWLLEKWLEKDIIIDNYKEIDYQPFNFTVNTKHLIIFLTIIIIGTYHLQSNKNNRYYFLLLIGLSYVFVINKARKI